MRILFISTSSGSRGGGEIFLLYLADALTKLGHHVGLWASRHPRMDELASRFAAHGDVIRADYRNSYDRWDRGAFSEMSRASAMSRAASWDAWHPDVVHLNKQNLEDGLDLVAATRALRTPNLCTVHITQTARFLGARFHSWRDRRARRILGGYRRPIVAVAPSRARELAKFLGPVNDIRTVNNGVPVNDDPPGGSKALRDREGLPIDVFSAVAVGRLEPQKQPLKFIEYSKRILAIRPDAQLRWIGSGRMAAVWDSIVVEGHLAANVRRIDWRNDVREILPAYNLFVHTAAYEGLPLALLEAMAAALPCAVEHDVYEQLPDSLRACCLPVDDGQDWRVIVGDTARLSEQGRRAHEAVRREFSTTAMARAYEAIYRELCAYQ